MTRTTAPYGTWASPITTDLIAGHTLGLGGVAVDGDALIWPESRPWEQGRTVLVRRSADGQVGDLTPPPYNVRSRVHEYGGGAHGVRGGTVVFSNFADNRVFRIDPGGTISGVTQEGDHRFGDFEFDPRGGRVACVREDHGATGEPENTIVALDLAGDQSGGQVLARGHDFFAYPRFSPDGGQLAWITWDHPNMPVGRHRSMVRRGAERRKPGTGPPRRRRRGNLGARAALVAGRRAALRIGTIPAGGTSTAGATARSSHSIRPELEFGAPTWGPRAPPPTAISTITELPLRRWIKASSAWLYWRTAA